MAEIEGADPAAGCTVDAGNELVPDGCWGRFPSSHYDIGCDEGAWNHLSRKVYCTFTDLAFQGARTATAVAAWMAGWAYGFDAANIVAEPALVMSESFDARIVGPLDLAGLAWFAMTVWVAWTALAGRVTHAAGEFVVSALLAGLAGILLANPSGYLHGTFDTMSRLSTITLAAGTGHAPPTTPGETGQVIAPIQAELHESFVEDPYDVLNWGTTNLSPNCAQTRDTIVATGPHGSDDGPRDAMNDSGCDELADFNHDPTAQRLFGAVLAFVAAVIMAVLIGLVALTVVVAQLAVTVAFIVAPFAGALAVLPGTGRGIAVRWVTMVVRAVIAMVAMSFLLAVLLMLIQAFLANSDSMPLFGRFALVDVAVVTAILARKRFITAGHGLAAGLGGAAAAARPGARTSSPRRPMPTPAAPGASGFGLVGHASSGPPGTIRRGAQTVGRYKLQKRAFNRRAGQTQATEHSQINPTGTVARSTTVTGPAPTTRRARLARSAAERRTARRAP